MERTTRVRRAIGSLVLVTGLVAAACAPSAPPAPAAAPSAVSAAPAAAAAGPAVAAPAPAAPAAPVAPAALTPVRFSITGSGGATAVLRLMNERNVWAEEGIKGESTEFQADTVATAALIAGELDFTVGGAESTVVAALRGADVRVIGLYQTRFEYQLIGSRDIRTPQDLKGRVVGVSRLGSNSHSATRQVLLRFGLDPENDVTIFQVGNTPERVAALQSGAIQAALMSPDVVVPLTQAGLPSMADMSKMDIVYPFQAVGTSTGLLERQPQVADAFLRAIYRGVRLFRDEPEAAQRILADRAPDTDKATLQSLWETYRGSFTTDLMPEPPVFALLLEELVRTDPTAQTSVPEQYLDQRPVRRVNESGFPQQLFGTR